MRVAVIGGGGFGTALAKLLAEVNHEVKLWCHSREVARTLCERRENLQYLPGVLLPETVRVTESLGEAGRDADMLVAMGPSHVMRGVVEQLRPHVDGTPILVSAAKGIEEKTHKRMTEVLLEVFGGSFAGRVATLSGPSFASEIAAGMPTAVTVAATEPATCHAVQCAFRTPTFRTYSSSDVVGVELGGSAKNVLAIATGVSDGLGLGSSSRAALITRGVAEIGRLVAAMDGDPRTVSGLSGLGDIVLTCTGELSRNRRVGMRLGRGERLRDILASMKMVAEGVRNSISVCELAKQTGTEMPIAEQVRQLLHEDKPARQVLDEFMSRESKPEF
jgi:glycerol-3-phosphate dehydrogenase (NAD(P)+)